MSANFPYLQVIAPTHYLERLQRRKDAITRLCATLQEYLCADIEAELEQAKARQTYRPARPTIEDLNAAQDRLDLAHAQLEAIRKACEDMPEKLGEMMRITQMPQIQHWLDQAQKEVSYGRTRPGPVEPVEWNTLAIEPVCPMRPTL